MGQLHVLFLKEGDCWYAQCLQYDIAAQGKTIANAKSAFEYAFATEMAYLAETDRTPDTLPQAPQCYWDIFERGASELQPIPSPPMRFPAKVAGLFQNMAPQFGLRVA